MRRERCGGATCDAAGTTKALRRCTTTSHVVDGCTAREPSEVFRWGADSSLRRNDASRRVERTSGIISGALAPEMLCFRIAVARVLGKTSQRTRRDARERAWTRDNGNFTTRKREIEREFRQSVAIRNKREARANKSPGPFFHFPGERRRP